MSNITDEQVIEALESGLSIRKSAEKLGCSHSNLIKRRDSLVRRGRWGTNNQLDKPAPEPFLLNRRSEHTGKDGTITGWNIYEPDKVKAFQMLQEAVKAMAEEVPPAPPVTSIPPQGQDNITNLYVITDYHLGMMAWGEETGADWDMKIAEDMLLNWFKRAIESAPAASSAILANIGDFLHWDGMEAVTPASKHLLDADTRFTKLIRVCIRVWRQIIPMLLQKYESLHVIMADANHDPASESWMREMLHAFYEYEPRVTVDTSADTYYCYEFGKVSLFFHHGHKRKPANIDTVFTAKFREEFGRTSFSYAHMGHLHSVDVKETNLMLVEQHRTLAAPDAYASRGGWISGRDAKVITYHKDYGEVARCTISADMLK